MSQFNRIIRLANLLANKYSLSAYAQMIDFNNLSESAKSIIKNKLKEQIEQFELWIKTEPNYHYKSIVFNKIKVLADKNHKVTVTASYVDKEPAGISETYGEEIFTPGTWLVPLYQEICESEEEANSLIETITNYLESLKNDKEVSKYLENTPIVKGEQRVIEDSLDDYTY